MTVAGYNLSLLDCPFDKTCQQWLSYLSIVRQRL